MRFEKSAGAVVYQDNKFLLLKYGKGHWGFVKGHVEKGETINETVMRELKEETGISDAVIIEGFSEDEGYYFNNNGLISKKVTYLLIKSLTNKIVLSNEHTNYAWLEFNEALKKLTFDNSKRILIKAREFLLSH